MLFLSKISHKKVSTRVIGKLAPYSISFSNCHFQWERSSILESAAKRRVAGLDGLYWIARHSNQIKCSCFIRIFVYHDNEPQIHTTFDLTTVDNLESEDFGVNGLRAARVRGVQKNQLNDDSYHENISVHINSFSILFELYIENSNDSSKDAVIKDFLEIVNSLKFKRD